MKVNKTLCLDPLDIIVNIIMLTNISDSGILKNTKIRNIICFNTCTRMGEGILEWGYDLLGVSKKGKDASKRIQAHKGQCLGD